MKNISIDLIRTEETQMRAGTRLETVEEYAALFTGKEWPFIEPLTVFCDGEFYWLADGFHRLQAAKQVKRASVKVEIKQGTFEDAQDYALAANQKHGLRRSNDDKRRAVEFALSCDRWRNKSDRMIAEHVGVSNQFVSNVRGQVSTVDTCETQEREGKDGKKYKLPKKDKAKTENTTEQNEKEYEIIEVDESEVEADDIDLGPVEEEEAEEQTKPIDWKQEHRKATALCTSLMRSIDDLNDLKSNSSYQEMKDLCDQIWEGLSKW